MPYVPRYRALPHAVQHLSQTAMLQGQRVEHLQVSFSMRAKKILQWACSQVAKHPFVVRELYHRKDRGQRTLRLTVQDAAESLVIKGPLPLRLGDQALCKLPDFP